VITRSNTGTALLVITPATFITSAARAFPIPLLPFFEEEFGISHFIAHGWQIKWDKRNLSSMDSYSLRLSFPWEYITQAAFNIYAFAALMGAVITYTLLKEN
jgi:hypothetical protein